MLAGLSRYEVPFVWSREGFAPASIALKPTSSIRIPGKSINIRGEADEVVTTGRHDPCVGIRATPIAEAMLALVLMDHLLRDRGQIGETRKSSAKKA